MTLFLSSSSEFVRERRHMISTFRSSTRLRVCGDRPLTKHPSYSSFASARSMFRLPRSCVVECQIANEYLLFGVVRPSMYRRSLNNSLSRSCSSFHARVAWPIAVVCALKYFAVNFAYVSVGRLVRPLGGLRDAIRRFPKQGPAMW